MRIGFATDSYKPYVSGVTHCVSLNKRYLEAHGHEVFVFAFADPRTPPTEHGVIHSPGIHVRGTTGFRVGPLLSREARRVLSTMDIVNVDNPFLSGPLALNVCRKHGIPVVYTNHARIDLYARFYANVAPALLRDSVVRAQLRRFCRSMDAVISPSEGMLDVLRESGVDAPVEVVRNGVDIGPFLAVPHGFAAADAARAAERARMGFSDEDVVFTYSGRLGPEKNLLLLVDSFARIADAAPHAKLLFVGGGPHRKKVEAAIDRYSLGERTMITGMVPYADIPRYLGLSDIWVSASISEVHPLTLIEAMAAGLPIVGVESPGVSDTVAHRVTGLLAASPEAGAISECMLTLANHPETRRAMALAAREAATRYSIDATGAELLGIYEVIVRETADRRAAKAASGPKRAGSVSPLR
jgi:1,2-diacylglycerol 3-alpha-glucosyltransferase